MGCAPSSAVSDDVDLPPDPSNDKPRMSVVSLQLPGHNKDEDTISALSVPSVEPPAQHNDPNEKLCGTEIRIDWLVRKLADHYPIQEQPQWIAERLNRKSITKTETSCVVRVTFAWDTEVEDLPKTVIVKVPLSKEAREDEYGRFYYTLYKRECNAYEWLQRIPNISAPKVYHIKRHGNEEGGAAVVMEDIGDRAKQLDGKNPMTIEQVQDLLNQLAFLHAQSWRDSQWSTLVADLPPSFYSHEAGNFPEIVEFFEANDVEPARMKKLEHYFSATYLENTETESCEELKTTKVLVHGEPFSGNIFVAEDNNTVAGLVDWTGCHSGCFGEDLAKAICWNLNTKDRIANSSSLLQAYHYKLVLYSGNTSVSAEVVRAAYDKFVPVAMVSFVHKVMLQRTESDVDGLVDRAKSILNQMYNTERMREEMYGDVGNADNEKNNNHSENTDSYDRSY